MDRHRRQGLHIGHTLLEVTKVILEFFFVKIYGDLHLQPFTVKYFIVNNIY